MNLFRMIYDFELWNYTRLHLMNSLFLINDNFINYIKIL